MISLVGKVTFNDDFHPGVDRYSDGDVEDEILALVKVPGAEAPAASSWPVLYHLSPMRRNLLEWYPFRPEGSLLEIGAGCGALTGLFCERTGSVTAVELSRRRAEILATRHREHANLTVYAGGIEDVRLARTFDVVTLIGVLEYAPRFLSGQDPAGSLLRRVHRLLAPGGTLILAIENRLGLKYWAGAREDHTGGFFDGLLGYPGDPGVRTYGKAELGALLSSAGFPETDFYYPMPDYKLPTDVYSDERLPLPGELARPLPSFDRDRLRLFDEGRVFDGLLASGLFPEVASSFLVLAVKGRGA